MVGSPDDDSESEKSSSDVNAGTQDGEIEHIEKQNKDLRRNRDFLEEIQEVANIGGWEFDLRSDRFRMTDTIHGILDLPADIDPTPEIVFDFYHPEDRDVVSAAFRRVITDGTTEDIEIRSLTTDGNVRWIRARGEPWYEDGNIAGARGTVQDITQRKRRESELQYRDEALRELHKTTQDLLNVETASDIMDCLVNHTLAIFDFDHFAVMRFIEADGVLQSVATSPEWGVEFDSPLVIEPGPHPIWEVYQEGETRVLEGESASAISPEQRNFTSSTLVVPMGNVGVVLAVTEDDELLSDANIGLMEILAANAEAFVHRVRRERDLDDALVKLAAHQSRMQELERVVESIRVIQQRATSGGSRDALETAVCEELVATDPIKFVWIGRPKTPETALSPVAWAGDANGYLDKIDLRDTEVLLPSQQAGDQRDSVNFSAISQQIQRGQWPKEALSYGFRSVISIPLLYDDVLYGVLTAYADEQGAFDRLYRQILTDVGTLLVHYINILKERQFDSTNEFVELEFELTDPDYQLHALATATDSKIRFDTIAETTEQAVRVLVTVLEGDAERVCEHATTITSITAAEWFGNPENKQLEVTIKQPFLASAVTKHVGNLVDSVSEDGTTNLFVKVPANVSSRPLIEAITSSYDVELVARRTRVDSGVHDNVNLGDLLTDRQFEILKAAYYGGYFESPRGINGQDLAASFDISSPVVYNHLQAAHRTILQRVFS